MTAIASRRKTMPARPDELEQAQAVEKENPKNVT